MALVTPPKAPWNGEIRWNELARRQSTRPARTGATVDTSARAADTQAMGAARRAAQRTPHRLTAQKAVTISTASRVTGIPGRYHWCRAEADSRAVTPQVGTHPHQ